MIPLRSLRSLLICAAVWSLWPGQCYPATPNIVLALALKCAVIGDDREWLDCFYGAAQSLRVDLGMTPVPKAQVTLSEAPPKGSPSTGSQEIRSAVLSSAFSCSRDLAQRAWLDCYYAAAGPMRSQIGQAPASASYTELHAPGRVREMPLSIEIHRVPLKAYTYNHAGIFTISLQNGEIWAQVDGDSSLSHWHKVPSNYLANITQGFWGSFDLTVSNDEKVYKVRRVQ